MINRRNHCAQDDHACQQRVSKRAIKRASQRSSIQVVEKKEDVPSIAITTTGDFESTKLYSRWRQADDEYAHTQALLNDGDKLECSDRFCFNADAEQAKPSPRENIEADGEGIFL